MDPTDPKQLVALCGSIESSLKKLAIFRENRIALIKQYVGNHYSNDGTKEPVPINFIETAVGVYTASLSGGTPQSQITTPVLALKDAANELQLDVNYVLKASNFKKTLQNVTREGLFGPGIVKIGIAESENESEGDTGQVFIDLIDLDDWVQDMSTRQYDNCAYSGHEKLMHREDLAADPEVDQAVLATLFRDDRSAYGDAQNRVESIAAGEKTNDETPIYDEIRVLHLWLRRERLIVLLPIDSGGKVHAKLLKMSPWTGPKTGPFEFVNFNPVPGNSISLPPLAVLLDLHHIINVIYNKLGRQSARQKNIAIVPPEMLKDGEKQVDAGDGDAVTGDQKAVAEKSFGGADERGMAFGMHAIERANAAGGNLEALGGTGPSADTLGQERIIKASASQKINAMQGTISDFIAAVIKQVAHYEFTDPMLERPLVKRLEGTSFERPFVIKAENMVGRFLDYNFEMQAYTNVARTPAEQLDAIGAYFDRFIAPYQEQMAAQEVGVDFNGFLHTVANLGGITQVDDFIRFGVPSSLPQQQMRGQDPRAPQAQRPSQPQPQSQRANPTRMIQDLMSRPKPQVAAV